MKKKSVLLSLIIMFSVFLFSACGVVGSKQVTGVKFSTSNMAEYRGQQVKCFTIAKGVEFTLPYEIFPNTAAEDAYVLVTHQADSAYGTTFDLRKNKFSIINDNFPEEGIKVTITVNSEYTDECLIKKATYPPTAELKGAYSDVVYEKGIYPLALSLKDSYGADIDVNNYKYFIESSDNTVIKVASASALTVQSTGKRGSAVVTLYFISDDGLKQKIGEKKLSVLMNVAQAKIIVNDNIIQNADKFTVNTGDRLEFSMLLLDKDGVKIENATISLNLIKGGCVTVVGNTIVANNVGDKTEEAIIEVYTNAVDNDGNVIKIRVTIAVVGAGAVI